VLVPLQGVDGEDEGVLKDGAEDHEDAGHHELVDGIELAGGGRRSAGANVVEDVDDDKEEDDQERHTAGDDLWVNHETNPGHRHKEAAGDVDLIYERLVLSLEKYLKSTGSIISRSQPHSPLGLRETSELNAVLESTFRTLPRLFWISKLRAASHRVSVVEVTSDLKITGVLVEWVVAEVHQAGDLDGDLDVEGDLL